MNKIIHDDDDETLDIGRIKQSVISRRSQRDEHSRLPTIMMNRGENTKEWLSVVKIGSDK